MDLSHSQAAGILGKLARSGAVQQIHGKWIRALGPQPQPEPDPAC